MDSKYRKYKMSGQLKFGDFLADSGKLLLNTLATPVEHVIGKDVYKPDFEGNAFNEINKYTEMAVKLGTDVVGNTALGPGYNLGKNLIQSGMNTQNTYKNGGMLTQINTGGKHEDNPLGGVPIGKNLVEEGETIDPNKKYVFSDSIVIDKDMAKEFNFKNATGKTFAQYSKFLEKQASRTNDRLDEIARKKMNERLINAQESYRMTNMNEDFNSKYKKFGSYLTKEYKKYDGGGKLNFSDFIIKYGYNVADPEAINSYQTYSSSYDENPYASNSIAQQNKIYDGGTLPEVTVNPESGISKFKKFTTDLKAGEYSESMNKVGTLAPIVANTISSFKHDKLDASKYKLKNRVNPYYMNIDPNLTDVRDAYANAQDKLKSGSGGNAGTYLANVGSLASNKYKAVSDIRTGKYNADKQSDMQSQIANLDVDKYNSQMEFKVDDWNMSSKEMAKNLAREAASNVGEYSWKNEQARSTEEFWKKYLTEHAKDFYNNKYGGYIKSKNKKC